MNCIVTDLATDFLGPGTTENPGKRLIRWHEPKGQQGEYRIPLGKERAAKTAIDELTLLTRKYGVQSEGPMYFIENVPYNLTPGKNQTHDYLIREGKNYYQRLVENEAFISEFQQKYDAYKNRVQAEQRAKNNNEQLKIEFDQETRNLKQTTDQVFKSSPEFFYIGSKEDYMDFLRENNRENDSDYLESNEAFEDFRKFVEDKNDNELYSPGEESFIIDGKRQVIPEAIRRNAPALRQHIDNKRETLQNLKENLSRYVALNKGRESQDSYNETVRDFHEVIGDITEEIGQLTATDAKTVFADIINEIETLSKSLDNIDMFKTENHEILTRLQMISALVTGKDISGKTIQTDGLIVFDKKGLEGFSEIESSVSDLQKKYDDFLYEVAKDAFLNDPIFVENKESFTEDELLDILENIKTKGKDINMLRETFLGINSNYDNILTKVVNDLFQMHVRRVEQNVLKKELKLEKLKTILKKQGFDIDKFYSKDRNGVKTGRLISKFSNAWYSAVSAMNSIRRDFDSSNNKLKPSKYNELMSWHEKNASFIDIRKLAVFKENYGLEFGEHFKFSEQEMSDYEADLREKLGRTYDDVINQQVESIENFLRYEDSQLNIGSIWSHKNVVGANPFMFLDNYYSEDRRNPLGAVVDQELVDVYNTGNYNSFIPLRQSVDSFGNLQETNYYDNIFERDFEGNNDAYEAQKIFQSLLSEHINPAYSVAGRNVSTLQIPMLRKEFAETFAQAKADGLISVVKASAHSFLNKQKDKWFDANYISDKKGIVSNFSDAAQRDVRNLKSGLYLLSNKDIIKRADDLGLNFEENTPREVIIDAIARTEVYPNYSNDIFQNISAVSSLASMQRARQNTTFIAEMLYQQFLQGDGADRHRSTLKFRDWLDTIVYGKRNRSKVEENNIVTQKGIKRLSDADKKLREIFKEVSQGEIGDNIKFNFEGKKYFQELNPDTGQIEYYNIDITEDGNTTLEDGTIVENEPQRISKDEFADFLNDYLKMRISNLGINMTFSSFVSGTLRNLSWGFLGLNPKAGVKNRIEGVLANSAADAHGILWKTGSDRHSVRILNGANLFRLSDGKLDFAARKKAAQLKSIDMLVQRLGILQDRRDFRDKKNQVSAYDKYKDILDPYNFAVGMPEYQNQITVMLNVLQSYDIKNYKGESIGFVNGDGILRQDGEIVDTGVYLPAYHPGTLELRDEYKYTSEAFNEDGTLKDNINLNDYINKDNIGFETFEVFEVNKGVAEGSNAIHMLNLRIQDSINKTQGNYSSMDSQVILGNNWGRFLMSFKRHTAEHINQRFGTFGNDIIQGKTKYEGRYVPLFRNPGALTVFGSALTGITFGPLIAGYVGGAGLLYWGANQVYNRYFTDNDVVTMSDNLYSAAGMLQEILLRTANIPLAVARTRWQLEDTKVWKQNQFLESLKTREVLTQDEVGAIKASAQEISVMVGVILATMLAKSMYSNDEDDEEAKQARNFIDNYGNTILQSINTFTNPISAWEDNTSVLLLAPVENAARFAAMVNKYYEGKATKGDVGISFLRAQPVVPVLTHPFKAVKEGGIDRIWKDEREYNSGQWWDKIGYSKEHTLRLETSTLRENIKRDYVEYLTPMYIKQYGYNERIAKKASEDMATKIMRGHPTSRGRGESWEELHERIDEKELRSNTKEYLEKYLREKRIRKLPPYSSKIEKREALREERAKKNKGKRKK